MVLDEHFKTFVVYLVALKAPLTEMTIHFLQKALITCDDLVQVIALWQNEVPIKILPKYANYADIFFYDLAVELPENTGINKYAIKLEKSKQPLYRSIYSLKPVKLETLKT